MCVCVWVLGMWVLGIWVLGMWVLGAHDGNLYIVVYMYIIIIILKLIVNALNFEP